jgi:hypothetical protein
MSSTSATGPRTENNPQQGEEEEEEVMLKNVVRHLIIVEDIVRPCSHSATKSHSSPPQSRNRASNRLL